MGQPAPPRPSHRAKHDRRRRLEDHTSELDDRLAAERAARQLLQRDVRWILRGSMGTAAVVSLLMSLTAQILPSLF